MVFARISQDFVLSLQEARSLARLCGLTLDLPPTPPGNLLRSVLLAHYPKSWVRTLQATRAHARMPEVRYAIVEPSRSEYLHSETACIYTIDSTYHVTCRVTSKKHRHFASHLPLVQEMVADGSVVGNRRMWLVLAQCKRQWHALPVSSECSVLAARYLPAVLSLQRFARAACIKARGTFSLDCLQLEGKDAKEFVAERLRLHVTNELTECVRRIESWKYSKQHARGIIQPVNVAGLANRITRAAAMAADFGCADLARSAQQARVKVQKHYEAIKEAL